MEEFYEDKVLPYYKDLLKECLIALNQIPNASLNRISKYKTTYDLASAISKIINNDGKRVQST